MSRARRRSTAPMFPSPVLLLEQMEKRESPTDLLNAAAGMQWGDRLADLPVADHGQGAEPPGCGGSRGGHVRRFDRHAVVALRTRDLLRASSTLASAG